MGQIQPQSLGNTKGEPSLVAPAAATLGITVLDCILLERKYSIFTGGFLNPSHLAGVDVFSFLLLSLWLDAAFAAPLVWIGLALLRRFPGLNPPRQAFVACLLALLPVEGANAVRFEVLRYFGDAVEFSVLRTIAGDNPANLLTYASTHVIAWLVFPLTGLLAAVLVFVILRQVPGSLDSLLVWRSLPPRVRVRSAAVLLAGSPLLMYGSAQFDDELYLQLSRKITGKIVGRLADSLTDFDRDGYGEVKRPRDPSPFDARVHPYAVDLPANGIDENGVNGDLQSPGSLDFENFRPVSFKLRPDFVLFVLESFRADAVGARVDGRPVTPVLQRLVADGAILGTGYSHNGFTTQSLEHLFRGSLSGDRSGGLIDDFRSNGYRVACISAQDESFGRIAHNSGVERADYFVDARNDLEQRVLAFTTPGSLWVPWTVVVRNVETFLQRERARTEPLFLYVNLHDCHFPYHHYGMKPLIDAHPIARAQIRPENATRLLRTYLNAAANVDLAVGEVLELFTRARRRAPGFVIVGDHGESLFDDGILGHGIVISKEQTAVPLIMGGIPAQVVSPVGLAEVRRIIREALAENGPGPSARVDPEKWVFQYIGTLERPLAVGAAAEEGGLSYRFETDQISAWGAPFKNPLETQHAVLELWEQLVLREAERSSVTGTPR